MPGCELRLRGHDIRRAGCRWKGGCSKAAGLWRCSRGEGCNSKGGLVKVKGKGKVKLKLKIKLKLKLM